MGEGLRARDEEGGVEGERARKQQGWEFAHLSWATVSDSLRSLKTNERL